MFSTSADILNMSLAIGWIVLVVFLCLFIFYGVLILRDVSKVVEEVEEVVDRVHSTIVEPLRAIDYIIEKAKPYIDTVIERRTTSAKGAKKKD